MVFSTRYGWLRVTNRFLLAGLFCLLFGFTTDRAFAQATNFAGNPQHTSVYSVPAQNLNAIKWTANIDFNNTAPAHYGAPLVTLSNTVLVPVKIANNRFRVDAFNGANGTLKYTTASDYVLPASSWIPVYNPCITTGAFGTRMYYAGIGGTLWHIDNPDSNTPGPPVREVFYTTLNNYNLNAGAYNSTIFINSPITADAAGNVYFGFRVQGTAPAPLSTSQSGFARIDPSGQATYVLAGVVTGDSTIDQVSHNVAPALSNDGTTLYVVAKGSSAKLLGLDSATLMTKYSVFLRDPRNGNSATVNDLGTASPMVAPDGDVYFGVLAPNTASRGFLLRFSGDLSVVKTPGAFGWDYTPGIVPASAVPSYTGSSPYLLFTKYNDYPFADGSGVNKVALLDPNATQIDPHPSANGLVEMREVLTVIGPTPDPDPDPNTFPHAVKEWCINAPAVNPSTNSVFFTSEDGHSYRWNLATNTLIQAVVLTPGILEPYVPTVIGPDGTVYTLNGGTLFALGTVPGVSLSITSSSPDLRNAVVGSPITFTATVTGVPASPGGTVTFTGLTHNGQTQVPSTLASNIPINANGQASFTTSSLAAGGGFLGNHFITATYSGDGSHSGASVTMVQKVHANASSLALSSSPSPSSFGQSVTFTAIVSSLPSGAGIPTGMVTFQEGATILGQRPLTNLVTVLPNSSAIASFTLSNLAPGSHNITATYASDTQFAASSAGTTHLVQVGTSTTIGSSLNPSPLGQFVVFTATVTASTPGAGTPVGQVDFKEGATILARGVLDATGHASFGSPLLAVGSHTITADFVGSTGWLNSSGTVNQVVQAAPADAPVLLIEDNFIRAVALDLVTQTRDPFTLTNPYNLSPDLRRRVSLFVWRLGLLPGDTAANVMVLAEDDQGRTYNLVVEFAGALTGVSEVTQVVVRLPDNVVGAPRDLWVKVRAHGAYSNSGVIRIAAP
ncbi:MAG TPA: Ig-like domain-containing protein [Pyrinomonadaceae bacterium]|nr:Ig-like domain-containing protein [Pyrinomonadaceae bacterium]